MLHSKQEQQPQTNVFTRDHRSIHCYLMCWWGSECYLLLWWEMFRRHFIRWRFVREIVIVFVFFRWKIPLMCSWSYRNSVSQGLIFGSDPTPFLLNGTFQKHFEKYQEVDPLFVKQILDNLYVDDYLGGADTPSSTLQLWGKLKERMKEGSLQMHN